MTFAELFEWWWVEYGSKLRGDSEGFLRKRLLPTLGRLPIVEVTAAKIEGVLQAMVLELSPKSLNDLRGKLLTIFSRAKERGLWQGLNPAEAVKRRKVPRKVFDSLKADEVPAMLAALEPEWRPLFACAVWTGLRKGELLGLQKADLDLADWTITVRRSYDHETTKGGHADVLPIAPQLRPFLVEAVRASPSEWVFPAADGSMRTDETDLQQILKRALARAGIVEGYRHVCRRKGCDHKEQAPDASLRRCPKPACLTAEGIGRALWPVALWRKIRFHDLRATTATLLARGGAPMAIAQRMLRHADPRLTANVYTRVDLADMRAGVDRMGIPQADWMVEHAAAVRASEQTINVPANGAAEASRRAFVPAVSPRAVLPTNAVERSTAFSPKNGMLDWSGRQDLNLRPPGPEPGALPG